jgi:hypothetical protein
MNSAGHPAFQSTPGKFRKHLGFLMNAEDILKPLGYDLAAAFRQTVEEHDRLEALADEAVKHPVRMERYFQAARQAEQDLFQRLQELVELLRKYHPHHPILPERSLYLVRWKDCLAAPPRPPFVPSPESADPPPASPREEPETFGVPWRRLQMLHARLSGAKLPHEFAIPFLIFLRGLREAVRLEQANPGARQPAPNAEAELVEAARVSLKDAVEFALQETAQALADSHAAEAGEREFNGLFMGVAYAQKNHARSVYEWLHQGAYAANLLRLLFAMGFLSASEPRARRLTVKVMDRLPRLIEETFGEEIARLPGVMT